MSDATLRQINGVVSKEGMDGVNGPSNLPLIEQLAGGEYFFKFSFLHISHELLIDCVSATGMKNVFLFLPFC